VENNTKAQATTKQMASLMLITGSTCQFIMKLCGNIFQQHSNNMKKELNCVGVPFLKSMQNKQRKIVVAPR
jgi:hypothetical protein